MKCSTLKTNCIGVMLFLIATSAAAHPAPGALTGYLPVDGEVAGWKLSEEPKIYRGDDLFMMIDGGADIYLEYGFLQVANAQYLDIRGKSIKLEIYEMESPSAAYGIFSFKIGEEGKVLPIGQEAVLEEYYLNFWKSNLQVTVIGPDSEAETVQGIVALARAVDARIARKGERPKMANLLLNASPGLSHPKYVRGPLGVMNSYIFDTENIFRVKEGMIGDMDGCRAFVFRYSDEKECSEIFANAVEKLDASPKFTSRVLKRNRYGMIDREKKAIMISPIGQYLAIVSGPNQGDVDTFLKRLIEKLPSKNASIHNLQ